MNKVSPEISRKEQRKLKDAKKKKEKNAAVSEVDTKKNTETENGTIKSKTGKKKSMSSEIKSVFDETERTKNIKKKRSRIIKIADSSDEEDYLRVN